MAGRNCLCFGLFFALLAISLDFRLNFAMPLQQESYREKTESLYKQMDERQLNLANHKGNRIAYLSNPWLNPYVPKLNSAKDLIRKPGRLLFSSTPAHNVAVHNPGDEIRRLSTSYYGNKKISSFPKISPYATTTVNNVPETRYYSAKGFTGQPYRTNVKNGQLPRGSDHSTSNEAALEEQIHKAYKALILKNAPATGSVQRSPLNVNPYIPTEHAVSYQSPASVRDNAGRIKITEIGNGENTLKTKSPWDNIQNINKESKVLEQRIQNAYSLLNKETNVKTVSQTTKPEQGFGLVNNDNMSSPLFVDKYDDLSGLSDSPSQDYDDMESQGFGSAVGESSGGESEQITKQLPSSQLQLLYNDILTMNRTQNGTLKPNSKIQLPGSRRTLTAAKVMGVFKTALKFADLLHKESSQLKSDASGDSVDNSSDSSPETVPDDVEDAVEAGGDIDDTPDSSKDSPSKQAVNTVDSPAEIATSSEDASASSSGSSSTDIGKDTEDIQPGSETQSTTAQANQRSDTMSVPTEQKTLAQANHSHEAAQQSDQSTYKFLNGDGDVETVDKNDDENENDEEVSDQTSTFHDSEQTISSKTDKQSSNYQFNDKQQKVKKPAGETTAYQFLNANGRIESVDNSELLAENEEKPKTLNYVAQTQDKNIADKAYNAPSFLESDSNDQSVSEQTPQNQEALNINPAEESPGSPVQTIPTQGALNTNFAGQTQSAPEPAVQNQISQNVQFTAADQLATLPAANLNNAAVQSQNTQEPNQFVNPNQNTEKLSYSHQPKSSPNPSFEFADQSKTSDNLNYAEQDPAPQNMNYADQSQATQSYVDQSQSTSSANQFVDQRQQKTPQNAYYADQSQSLPNSADQSQSFSQGSVQIILGKPGAVA